MLNRPEHLSVISDHSKRIVLAKTFLELLGSRSQLHRDYNGKPDNPDLPVRWVLCGWDGVTGLLDIFFLKVSARNLSLIRSIKPAILEKPSQISPIHVNLRVEILEIWRIGQGWPGDAQTMPL